MQSYLLPRGDLFRKNLICLVGFLALSFFLWFLLFFSIVLVSVWQGYVIVPFQLYRHESKYEHFLCALFVHGLFVGFLFTLELLPKDVCQRCC